MSYSSCSRLDSDVFNELTVSEIQEEINRIALPIDQRNRIKSDVKQILRR